MVRARWRAAGHGLVLGLAACGEDGDRDVGGGGAPAATTASVATTSSVNGSSSTAGGDGGGAAATTAASGGAGDGGGGDDAGCPLTADRVAAGASFTCVVGDDATLRCRGGAFGAGWTTVALDDGDHARCVEHVAATGEGLCVRVADGDGCPAPGAWCTADVASPPTHVGAGPLAVPVGDGVCLLDRAGGGACPGLDAAESDAIAPLGGLDGGPGDACAWGAGGVRCWGETATLQADAPDLAGCPADVAVGDGFACVAWSGFDVVDCWGELPPSVPARVFIAGPAEDVAVGDGFVCARTVSGLVRCWGDDAAGGLGVAGDGTDRGQVEPDWPDGPESVAARAIAAGVGHVATLDDDGARVLAWGRNDAAQVCSCASELVDTPVDAEHPDPEP